MPQQRLYYDYVDNQLIPFWYVLTYQHCELNWDKPVNYYDAIKPFEYVERGEFDETLISTSIYLSDVIFNRNFPSKIGINLQSVKKRIERHGVDPYVVRQFIISTPEINELLLVLPTDRKISFVVNQ